MPYLHCICIGTHIDNVSSRSVVAVVLIYGTYIHRQVYVDSWRFGIVGGIIL
jgi:hypothetical protein